MVAVMWGLQLYLILLNNLITFSHSFTQRGEYRQCKAPTASWQHMEMDTRISNTWVTYRNIEIIYILWYWGWTRLCNHASWFSQRFMPINTAASYSTLSHWPMGLPWISTTHICTYPIINKTGYWGNSDPNLYCPCKDQGSHWSLLPNMCSETSTSRTRQWMWGPAQLWASMAECLVGRPVVQAWPLHWSILTLPIQDARYWTNWMICNSLGTWMCPVGHWPSPNFGV